MKAGIYARVSTREQAEEGYSIENQIENAKLYCKMHNIPYEIFVDDGYSGKDLKRPAIQKLLNEVENGNITHVIVFKLDRLSRKLKDILYVIDLLTSKDAVLISLKENIDISTALGRLLLNILSSFAEFERENIRERVKDVIDVRKKKTLKPLGHPPLGYDDDFKIIEEEAKIVRLIFEKARYSGIYKIVDFLNKNGYRSKNGIIFSKTTVHQILTNITYTGKIKIGNELIKGNFEAIIDENLFNEVQENLKRRKHIRKGQLAKGLVSGIIYCGYCLKKAYLVGGKDKQFYLCLTKHAYGTSSCESKRWKKEYIDTIVSTEVIKLIKENKEDILKDLEAVNDVDVSEIKKKILNIENRISKLIDLYEFDEISKEELTERVSKLKEEKEELLSKLAEEREQRDFKEYYSKLLDNFEEVFKVAEFEERKALMQSVLDSIVYYNDKVEITFKTGKTVTIPFEKQQKVNLSEEEIKKLKEWNTNKAIALLELNNGLTAKEIAYKYKFDFSKIVTLLNEYKKKGIAAAKSNWTSFQELPKEVEEYILNNLDYLSQFNINIIHNIVSKETGYKVSNQMIKNWLYKNFTGKRSMYLIGKSK